MRVRTQAYRVATGGAMAACMAVSAVATDWWNPAWGYHVPARVNFGMEETENPLVIARVRNEVVKATSASADAEAFRVVDDRGSEVPSAVRVDADGDFFVVWRIPGKTEILDTRNYRIYFDSSAGSTAKQNEVHALAEVAAIIPGMNLISNGDFSELDAKGFPKGWANIDFNSGRQTAWREADKNGVSVVELAGRRCLRLAGGRSAAAAVRGLEAGACYKMSLLGTVDPGATILVTILYRRANFDWFRNGIGNYKTQFMHSKPGPWSRAEAATFTYTDKAGIPRQNNRNLLPDTETAYVMVENHQAPGQAFVYVTELRFELAGDATEATVVIGEPTKIPGP